MHRELGSEEDCKGPVVDLSHEFVTVKKQMDLFHEFVTVKKVGDSVVMKVVSRPNEDFALN